MLFQAKIEWLILYFIIIKYDDIILKNKNNFYILIQELPKLIRGYHKCSIDEAVQLAACIYRVRYGDSTAQFENIQ